MERSVESQELNAMDSNVHSAYGPSASLPSIACNLSTNTPSDSVRFSSRERERERGREGSTDHESHREILALTTHSLRIWKAKQRKKNAKNRKFLSERAPFAVYKQSNSHTHIYTLYICRASEREGVGEGFSPESYV